MSSFSQPGMKGALSAHFCGRPVSSGSVSLDQYNSRHSHWCLEISRTFLHGPDIFVSAGRLFYMFWSSLVYTLEATEKLQT